MQDNSPFKLGDYVETPNGPGKVFNVLYPNVPDPTVVVEFGEPGAKHTISFKANQIKHS